MPYYIDHTTNPSLSLVKALRMSSCIPLYFEPILYNSKYYIDGSILNHFGIELFDNKDPEVFGVLLSEYTICNKITNFDNYISSLFEMILNVSYVMLNIHVKTIFSAYDYLDEVKFLGKMTKNT